MPRNVTTSPRPPTSTAAVTPATNSTTTLAPAEVGHSNRVVTPVEVSLSVRHSCGYTCRGTSRCSTFMWLDL